jgi:hypothetical protein
VARLKVCANLQVLRPSEQQWKPRLRQAATTLGEDAIANFSIEKRLFLSRILKYKRKNEITKISTSIK